MSKEALDNNV